jgi:hypothetical protein
LLPVVLINQVAINGAVPPKIVYAML